MFCPSQGKKTLQLPRNLQLASQACILLQQYMPPVTIWYYMPSTNMPYLRMLFVQAHISIKCSKQNFSCLSNGKLGRYIHIKCSIQLKDPNITPIFCTTYPIQLVHQQVLKQELQHIIDGDILQRIPGIEWDIPTFFIPKKHVHLIMCLTDTPSVF